MGPKLHYRPDIDGLRAVAIAPVVLYHAGVPAVPGGYIGVDVFFVISGFLIAGIITREIDKGRFSIVHFYERRARRLLPALFSVVAATLLIGWLTSWPGNFVEIAASALASIFFASNFYFWETTSYFSLAAEYRPFLHTWSLAVEEQFYIFFPLFLILLAKLPRSRLILTSCAILAISLAASVVATYSRPVAAFYLAPFRAWELFIGVLLALNAVPCWTSRTVREGAALVGVVLIASAAVTYSSSTPFPGLAAVAPCVGAALIIQAGRGGAVPTIVSRLLSCRPFVLLGLISYSLYLWHWALLALARSYLETPDLPTSWVFLCVSASLVLAALSWRFVERPFRAGTTFSRAGVFRFSGAAAAVLACASISVMAADGFPGRISPEALVALAGEEDVEDNRDECMDLKPNQNYCVIGATDSPPSGLLLGDSHAAAIMSAVDVALDAQGVSAYVASSAGCAPLLGVTRDRRSAQCRRFISSVLEYIEDNRRAIKYVILAARWPLLETGERLPGETGRSTRLIALAGDRDLSNHEAFEVGLRALVEAIHARDASVIILGAVPEIGWHVPRNLAVDAFRGRKPPAPPTIESLKPRQAGAEQILQRAAQRQNVTLIPITPLLCNPVCQVSDGAKPLYIDDDHLSRHGARNVLGPKLAGRLADALGSSQGAAAGPDRGGLFVGRKSPAMRVPTNSSGDCRSPHCGRYAGSCVACRNPE